MAAGFNAATVQDMFQKAGRGIVAVNAGLGSTSSIEHLALTRLAWSHHTVQRIVYGFFDQQMAPEGALKNSDLIGNYAMLYYLEPRLALRYGRFDWLDRVEFQAFRCCALLQERGTIWSKVERLRRDMQEIGMPRAETNQFGRRADFNLLEFADTDKFALGCRDIMRSGDFLSPPIQELLREARDHGARVTVVEMPMHPFHLKQFYDQPIWDAFRVQNRAAVEHAGASYVDGSHWIPNAADYQDHLHLSESGAVLFSQRLAEELLKSP
jgi:hypothetical protein